MFIQRSAITPFAVLVALFCVPSVLSVNLIRGEEKQRSPTTDRDEAPNFLNRYCLHCHGDKKAEADLSFQSLAVPHVSSSTLDKKSLDIWKLVFDKLESGEMPPEDAQQPAPQERIAVVRELRQKLLNAGISVHSQQSLDPSRGNWIDHDALFSQVSNARITPTATQVRLWRLTGQAYEAFVQQKNEQFKLGLKNYGEHKMRAPWNFTPEWNFSDYAASHKIGEAEIEYHMRNATTLAKALVAKHQGKRPSPGYSDWVKELADVLRTGTDCTAEHLQTATIATFKSILGREPTQESVERYSGFLAKNFKELGTEKAVEHFLIAILFQPEVLYRIETLTDGSTRRMLPPQLLARSLSYALTDHEPDPLLREAARDGRLTTRDHVREQVERLLNDKEIEKPRVLRFFQEYFGHHKAKEVFKDEKTLEQSLKSRRWHPYYFVSDADRLIESVLAEDKQVLRELLTTHKTFALTVDRHIPDKQAQGSQERTKNRPKPFQQHEQLALAIYEVDVSSNEWSPAKAYSMPAEHRMGILTHPAWLIAQSGNFDNHAIHRGRWIREKLLGGRVPEVPITVNAMLPDEPHRTLRDRMQVTREEYCWTCHRRMDPLGMPFEQFDHFGRYRTEEQVMDKERTEAPANLDKYGKPRATLYKNLPLDTTGNIEQSGDSGLDGPVGNPFELIQKLATSKRVEQVFVRHAFRYFIGRNETLTDGYVLMEAYHAYTTNGGSMNKLITSLLTSDAFLYRGK